MNHCSQCGAPVSLRVPPGDNLARYCCDTCGTVHYRNPLIVTGCIVEHADGRLLLCRRAIEPRYGLWTMPAGFMELDETLEAGALRETREEACAEAEIIALHSVISVPRMNQVHLMFRARMIGDAHAPGAESLETGLVAEPDIPWDALAFTTVRAALERFVADRRRGTFDVHELAL